MTHPIFVCIPHRLTFHTIRIANQHAKAHDPIISYKALFVKIGTCPGLTCGKKKLIPSSPEDINKAKDAAWKLASNS